MIEAKPFPQEAERIASLKALNLLDTPIQERFERVTRMVCRTLDVPIALFNLVDEDRQHYKSVQGLTNTDASLEAAFCTHAIHEENILLIPDTSKDERFFDNPFVTGQLQIGFYAGCPVRTPNGMPIGTLCAIDTKPRDVTQDQLNTLYDLAAMLETELRNSSLSKLQAKLIEELDKANRLSLIDPLTRLWNRDGITKLLEVTWKEAAAQHKPLTIVMGDIDHFKKINDSFGHPVGDAVLQALSKRLLKILRTDDGIGRMGGEEFIILLPNCPPEKVPEIVDRIRGKIATEPVAVGDARYFTTMSFGAATVYPNAEMNYETAIKKADDALYKAKKKGRNCVEVA